MTAIREAIASGQEDRIPELMSDRWLQQVTLYGSAAEVRENVHLFNTEIPLSLWEELRGEGLLAEEIPVPI